jgi:hypothetical protein
MHHSDSYDCENANGCSASRAQHRSLARETIPHRNEDRKEHRDARNRAECNRRRESTIDTHTSKCAVESGNCECCQGKSQSSRLSCSTNGDIHWWRLRLAISGESLASRGSRVPARPLRLKPHEIHDRLRFAVDIDQHIHALRRGQTELRSGRERLSSTARLVSKSFTAGFAVTGRQPADGLYCRRPDPRGSSVRSR